MIDWDYVKKTTLWQYEELVKKLDGVLVYPVIRQAYDHSMPQAIDFTRRLFPASNLAADEFPADIIALIYRLEAAGLANWTSLLALVKTRQACLAFIEKGPLDFKELIDVLNFLLRWALPFQTASRELLAHDDEQEMASYAALKKHKLMNSLDLLEGGRTPALRQGLAGQTGLPEGFVTSIVHRADIARLPYVRRKTILPVCGAGYDTLAKIAAAEIPQMEADLDAYFQRTQGKRWEDFKSVIVLRGLQAGARALPAIIS